MEKTPVEEEKKKEDVRTEEVVTEEGKKEEKEEEKKIKENNIKESRAKEGRKRQKASVKTEKIRRERRPVPGVLWCAGMLVLCLLLTASLLATAFCGIGTYYLVEKEYLWEQTDVVEAKQQEEWGENLKYLSQKLIYMYLHFGFSEVNEYCDGTNIRYAIYSVYGRRLGGNIKVSEEGPAEKFSFTRRDIHDAADAADYYIMLYLGEKPEGEISEKEPLDERWMEQIWGQYRYQVVIGFAVGILVSVVLFALLIRLASGRGRKNQSFLAKVPADLLTIGYGFLLWKMLVGRLQILKGWVGLITLQRIADFTIVLLLIFFYLIHMFRRAQQKEWYHNAVLYGIYRLLYGLVSLWIQVYRNLNLVWKEGILMGVLAAAEAAVILFLLPVKAGTTNILLVLWGMEKIILLPMLLYRTIVLSKLQEAAHKVAGGDLSYQVDMPKVPGLLQDFSRDMNAVAGSISVAVEERLKSERLKTELITNVSHDIKTPLTSIINFSDLILREKPENPKIAEYAEHLHGQSTRLKKLIEDLMEASKASTGNLVAKKEICDVRVLLGQCIGEYEPRLAQHQLELIVKQCPEPFKIMADTRMLWRVFDNLMNNICKYAQAGTRVYLSTEKLENRVQITFKNVSKYALDISPEELMERFVRGDLSRHTEGNGLGLSIVRSLMDLQGGKIELAVDGDLFKAILEFPVLAESTGEGTAP